ncbi:amino acid permease-domain-containing protein [Suillus clintonianus]|uniref:amino acid permease-domain-containing protein n=1 Tax=Suillus clintonianus TaxID=1904413 RepID=UPI001B862807|nr:amino acid permease-domain-containing protein [Suillus clintonianus]KAG2116264.1 amino acid permease-domain-containing protein [Suillus clintonianus]
MQTLKIAGPLGLGICAVLYLLTNVAYFAAATKTKIEKSGVTVAVVFFGNVFGSVVECALSVFIALSALGNVITVTFAASRVNQGRIPLPFGNKFWASNWPAGKSPLPGLIIHLIPSGLFYLRWKKPDIIRPFKVWWPLAVFFLGAASFPPFLKPTNGVGDTPPLPYYLYCLVGIALMFAGMFYWVAWRILLPKVFGYELVPRKERLDDGTVVTVVAHGSYFAVFKQEDPVNRALIGSDNKLVLKYKCGTVHVSEVAIRDVEP